MDNFLVGYTFFIFYKNIKLSFRDDINQVDVQIVHKEHKQYVIFHLFFL